MFLKINPLKTHPQLILLSIPAGALLGIAAPPIAGHLYPLGKLFIRALQMVAIPLVFFSISSAVINVGSAKEVGSLTLKSFAYYLASMTLAILTGFFLFQLIKPGEGINLVTSGSVPQRILENKFSYSEFFLKIIPDNPIAALAQGDFMAVIFFAIVLGIAILKINEPQALAVKNLLNAGVDTMIVLTRGILYFAPIGVAALMAHVTATHLASGKLTSLALGLGKYATVVFLGLNIQMFLILPVMVWLLAKINPYRLMKQSASALFTAFASASSNATLPVTLEALKTKAKLPERVVSFTVPLGATCNMDGTALYECVVVLFLAQAHGVTLGVVEQIQVILLSLFTAIGVAGIPMGSMVMMALILKTLGLPAEWLALIIPLDRILDMCRTTVNVWDDCCGAAIISRWSESDDGR